MGAAFVALLMFVSCVRPPMPDSSTAEGVQALAFVDVSILDPSTGTLSPHQTVVAIGDRLSNVGPMQEVAIPAGSRVVRGDGAVLLPGLWDMHTHALQSANPASLRRIFGLLLASGVTGIRDMGTALDTLRAARAWLRTTADVTPRIIASGPLLDGPRHAWSQRSATHLASPEQVTPLLDTLQRGGVDFFKVYGNLSRETFFAVAADARRRGIDIAGHVPQSVMLSEALAAGQRTFEHLGVDTYTECTPGGPLRLQRALSDWVQQGYGAWYRHRLAMRADRESAGCATLRSRTRG
jgi:imidazolonepropionase-like amidohydrolase